jgi:hypothetical protein
VKLIFFGVAAQVRLTVLFIPHALMFRADLRFHRTVGSRDKIKSIKHAASTRD